MYRALKFSRVRVVSGVSPLTMTDIAAIVPVVVSRKSRRVVGGGWVLVGNFEKTVSFMYSNLLGLKGR